MLILNVAIEHGTTGFWYGRLIEFLGTHARAISRTELLKELDAELRYHLQWLQRYREHPKVVDNVEMIVKEEVSDIAELGESGGEVALFDFDHSKVDRNLLDTVVRYMGYNRSDLLDLCINLDETYMTRTPEGKGRSIEDILQHVCNAEEFYISRLGKSVDGIYERYLEMPVSEADRLPTLERLDVVRTACIRTLQKMIPTGRNEVFQRAEYTKYPKENWTKYKVLRRFLEHEREHIYNIREYQKIPIRPSQ